LAEQLAVDVIRLLTTAENTDETAEHAGGYYTLDDLRQDRGPPDYAPSQRYEQAVSFEFPVNVGAPNAPLDSLVDEMTRLAPLRDHMRQAFSRAYGDPPPGRPANQLATLVNRREVPVAWIDIAIESGLIINYPGNAVYSPQFDTRKRPWYTMAKGKHGPVWGPPVPDDSGLGILVPCSVGLYDEAGTFLGVTSFANGLEFLVDQLHIKEIPPMKAGYLVEKQGNIVIWTGDEQTKVTTGLHGNRARRLIPFPDAVLIDAIKARQTSGTIETGDDILVFIRLLSLRWYYVVRVDAEEFESWNPT
ncbi:MAG: cache domain-containing protein, partial [Proteobacteria bacterium]|nr:cache domain-containing protein [Pseudomonadota bacterium]